VRARLDAQEARFSRAQFRSAGADCVRERVVEQLSKIWSSIMTWVSKVFDLSGSVLGLTSAASFTGGKFVTRSVDDANADLMST
jgi:hypothetical protein